LFSITAPPISNTGYKTRSFQGLTDQTSSRLDSCISRHATTPVSILHLLLVDHRNSGKSKWFKHTAITLPNMASNEYYNAQAQAAQQPANQTYYEPPKSLWECPQNLHQAPQPVYQSQGQHQGQPQYHAEQQYPQGYGGQEQPQVVVVKERRGTEDAALGFCAGCATACCFGGCTVM